MTKQTKPVTEQALTLNSISDLLDRKLEEKLEEKLDQKLDEKLGAFEVKLNKKFEAIDQRFGDVEAKLDRTINEVADLKQDMVIVKDFLANEVMTKTDGREIIAIVDGLVLNQKKFDQEQTMHSYRLREHTKQIDNHTKEIKELQLTVTG